MQYHIINIESGTSSNDMMFDMLKDKKLETFTALSLSEQTKGRGQGSNSWFSERNKNLTFSLYYQPILEVKLSNIFSFWVSISLLEVLKELGLKQVMVKPPNDLYIANKKISGLLIEPIISHKIVKSLVIGIGLNVNQINFGELEGQATSVKLETKKEYETIEVLISIIERLRYNEKLLTPQYFNFLEEYYNKNVLQSYKQTF